MKLIKITLLSFITLSILALSCKSSGENNNSNNTITPTYSEPVNECQISTSKVRSLVRDNWSSIKSAADFKVSDKKSFEITNYGMDGAELTVDVYSKGYVYDISFTVSFNANFTKKCDLTGNVTDVYNYIKH